MSYSRLLFILNGNLFVLIPFIFYFSTMGVTIGFGDTALLVDAIRQKVIESHVNNHPFTVVMGVLFDYLLPFDDIARRANFVSVIFGSFTVSAFYFLVLNEVRSKLMAMLAASLLMVSHSMWWHSTIIENYAVSAFFSVVALLLWQALRNTRNENYLYWLCVVAGLSVSNHIQMSFLCVGVACTGILFARTVPGKFCSIIGRCMIGAVVGLLPWLILLLIDAVKSGDFSVALKGALWGSFSGTFFSGDFYASLKDVFYLLWFQSPAFLLLIMGVYGFLNTFRASSQDKFSDVGILVFFLLNTLNFAFYATWDKFAFLLNSFVVLSFYMAVGISRFYGKIKDDAFLRTIFLFWVVGAIIAPLVLYSNIASWAESPRSVWAYRYNNNYSSNLYRHNEFVVNPDKSEYVDVKNFSLAIFEKLPKNSIFLDDDSRTYYPLALYFQKYYNMRPDVQIIMMNSWGIDGWGLDSGSLSEKVKHSLRNDIPFFLATKNVPFHGFVKDIESTLPVRFLPFYLDEKHFIYKMESIRDSH